MSNAQLAKAKQIEVTCCVCGKTFTRRSPGQTFCSRACVSRKFAGQSRKRFTPKADGTGVTWLRLYALPQDIQRRIDRIVEADLQRRMEAA